MKQTYYVYILRNSGGILYIGITNNVLRRVWEHKLKHIEGYTKQYNIDKLVYFETYDDPNIAIAREKQLKNWNRIKK